jgi:hypothetical protein
MLDDPRASAERSPPALPRCRLFGAGDPLTEATMNQIVTLHPHVVEFADLARGEERSPR